MRRAIALALTQELVKHSRALGLVGRRRRIPRKIRPNAIALSYFQAIRRMLERARALVRERLEPRLAGWSAEFRRDAASEEVDAAIAGISATIVDEFDPSQLKRLSEQYARATSAFQREQLQRQIRAALGVDLFGSEPDLEPRFKAFAAENASLIRSTLTRPLAEVEALVLRGVQAGKRAEELAGEIEDRFGVAESRAALIARDQIGKFFAAVDQERQTALGITSFIWRTAGDERVRESHAALDGQEFEWTDPPIVDGEAATPGTPINCRCEPEPVFDGILAGIEK